MNNLNRISSRTDSPQNKLTSRRVKKVVLRRGRCVKGECCGFSHQNLINSSQNKHHKLPKIPKSIAFCPFLRRRAVCLKESRCDFSHVKPPSSKQDHLSLSRIPLQSVPKPRSRNATQRALRSRNGCTHINQPLFMRILRNC